MYIVEGIGLHDWNVKNYVTPKKGLFGQNWPQIHILQPNGMKHRFLDLKIINYRHCYPRNDLLQYLKLLFSPSNIFSHFWQ